MLSIERKARGSRGRRKKNWDLGKASGEKHFNSVIVLVLSDEITLRTRRSHPWLASVEMLGCLRWLLDVGGDTCACSRVLHERSATRRVIYTETCYTTRYRIVNDFIKFPVMITDKDERDEAVKGIGCFPACGIGSIDGNCTYVRINFAEKNRLRFVLGLNSLFR